MIELMNPTRDKDGGTTVIVCFYFDLVKVLFIQSLVFLRNYDTLIGKLITLNFKW